MAILSIRSATKSLWHHILFILVFASLPTAALFLVWAYQDGDLTVGRGLQIISVWIIAGLIGALVGWYVILASVRRRSDQKKGGGSRWSQ